MIFRTFALVITLITISSAASAQLTCAELFIQNDAPAIDVKKLMAVDATPKDPQLVTTEEVKLFSGNDGSLQVILKSPSRRSESAVAIVLSNLILQVTQVRPANFKNIWVALNVVTDGGKGLFLNAKRGDWGTKKIIISAILALEPFVREAVGDPSLNLLTLDSWLKVYAAKDLNELNVAYENTEDANKKPRIVPKGIAPDKERTDMLTIMNTATGDSYRAAVALGGIVKSGRHEHYANEVVELIHKLHLPVERQEHYLRLLHRFQNTDWFSSGTAKGRKILSDLRTIAFYIAAFVERFPQPSSLMDSKKFQNGWFMLSLKATEQFDRVYQINEQRLDENLDLALSINEQVKNFLSDAENALSTKARLKSATPEFTSQIAELETKAQQLVVTDLTTEDLTTRINNLQSLQFELNQAVEKVLENVESASIENFTDLNFSWSRIVVDKSYHIEGRDYDSVVFEKNVVNFLKHETSWGDRCLAALFKGYVGTQNQSGLRMVTEIHKDLRYIKVMGRKLRLIGKLKGRTLHFFEVYTRTETFDQAWLRQIIDNH